MLEAATGYYRPFYMGLIREGGTPKLALSHFARHTPDMGNKQRFHFEDSRPDDAVAWLNRLDATCLGTGLGVADSTSPGREKRLEGRGEALADFDTTATFCFTRDWEGILPRNSSPPKDPMHSAEFCARMIERHVPARPAEARIA